MIVLANLLNAIAQTLSFILNSLWFIILLSALVSWVNADPYNPIVRFLTGVTEPLLRPIRKYVPPIGGRVDISPLILILIVFFLQHFLVGTLIDYAGSFRLSSMTDSLPMRP